MVRSARGLSMYGKVTIIKSLHLRLFDPSISQGIAKRIE